MGSHFHHTEAGETSPIETRGSVWNWTRRYDLLIGLVTLGGEQAFRQRITHLAQLQPGERVLDVGCGTGMLAMEALQRVGKTGHVSGYGWKGSANSNYLPCELFRLVSLGPGMRESGLVPFYRLIAVIAADMILDVGFNERFGLDPILES